MRPARSPSFIVRHLDEVDLFSSGPLGNGSIQVEAGHDPMESADRLPETPDTNAVIVLVFGGWAGYPLAGGGIDPDHPHLVPCSHQSPGENLGKDPDATVPSWRVFVTDETEPHPRLTSRV